VNKAGQDRPGSAGKNRSENVKPSVWLSDMTKDTTSLKNAEKNLDKDIFRNGSPKKKKKPERKSVAQEDPGPHRPTTAKRRAGRPSSAERNRDAAVKPSVWLENIARDSKAGNRSFIECTPSAKKAERPSSADRKRGENKDGGSKKKKKKSVTSPHRPSSAERNRGDLINNAVWLDGEAPVVDNNERPSSAGRRRSVATDNNGNKLDQNGKGLAPLKGTPLKPSIKPILRPGKAAEI